MAALVDSLQSLLGGAALGDPRIVVHPVRAQHPGSRLQGAPSPGPMRVRVLRGADVATGDKGTVPIDDVRAHIAKDLADDVARLLASGATFRLLYLLRAFPPGGRRLVHQGGAPAGPGRGGLSRRWAIIAAPNFYTRLLCA